MKLAEGIASWLPSTLAHEPVLTQLALAAIAVCVAAFIVGLTLIVLRVQSHRTKAVLWLTVLIVPMLSLAMLNLPSLFTLEMTAQAEALPVVQSGLPIVREVVEILPQALPDSGEVFYIDASALGASETTTANEEPTRSATPTIPIPLVITIAWAAIVCFFIGRLMLDSLKRLRIQRRASAPNAEVTQRWEAQLTRLGLSQRKAPRLLVTTGLESPALLGCVRPTILIPTWLAEREDSNALEWAMRHELTHWKHNDHWANAARRIAEALFFFHPIVWWASRKWDTSAELACDRSVIASEAEAEQYTGELYTMFTMIQSRRKMRLACGLFATRIQIADRIKALTTNPLRMSGSLTLSGWLASLLILAVAFTASAVSIEFIQPVTDPPVAPTQPAPDPVNLPEVIAEINAAPTPLPAIDTREITTTEHNEPTPPTAETTPSAIKEEPPVAPQATPQQDVQPTVKPEQAVAQETTRQQTKTIETPPTRLAKQTPPTAETEQREDILSEASTTQYSIETKVILIPKDVHDSIKRSGRMGLMFVTLADTENNRIHLPLPASMEAFIQKNKEAAKQSSSIIAHLQSEPLAYKVRKDTMTDEFAVFIGEKMKGELLSAPRVTIKPSPENLFKVLMLNPDSKSGGGFGGVDRSGRRAFGRGGSLLAGPQAERSSGFLENFRNSGMSPEIFKLLELNIENPGSATVIADITWSEDNLQFEKGIALAFAISPDPTSDAVKLHTATHYRMNDYTMERKGAFRRLKRVHAGTVDIQMNHQETLAPDEALVLVRLMPHSGDTLLTVITVDKVHVAGTKFFEAPPTLTSQTTSGERYPRDVREKLNEGDTIIAIVPQVGGDSVRFWVTADSNPLKNTNSPNPRNVLINVIVANEQPLYFAPSMDGKGLSLKLLGTANTGKPLDEKEGRYPNEVREKLKDGDVVMTIVPKIEKNGIRLWVGPDNNPLGKKTNTDVWTNVIVSNQDVLYFTPSMDNGLSLELLGIKRSKQPENTPADQVEVFEKLLDKLVSLRFKKNMHVSDIIESLSGLCKINIVIDQREVQPKDPSEVDPGATYTTDGVIGFISLESVELRQALRAILRPLNLDYSIQPGFIWISTPENLKHETFEDLETRQYELPAFEIKNVNADLEGDALAPIDIENLLRHLIPEIVDPTTETPISFMRLGEDVFTTTNTTPEDGRITETIRIKLLYVHTTPKNHRKIEEMLALIK